MAQLQNAQVQRVRPEPWTSTERDFVDLLRRAMVSHQFAVYNMAYLSRVAKCVALALRHPKISMTGPIDRIIQDFFPIQTFPNLEARKNAVYIAFLDLTPLSQKPDTNFWNLFSIGSPKRSLRLMRGKSFTEIILSTSSREITMSPGLLFPEMANLPAYRDAKLQRPGVPPNPPVRPNIRPGTYYDCYQDDDSGDEFDHIPDRLPPGAPLRIPLNTPWGMRMFYNWPRTSTITPKPCQLIPPGYSNARNQVPRGENTYVPQELRPKKRKQAPTTQRSGHAEKKRKRAPTTQRSGHTEKKRKQAPTTQPLGHTEKKRKQAPMTQQ